MLRKPAKATTPITVDEWIFTYKCKNCKFDLIDSGSHTFTYCATENGSAGKKVNGITSGWRCIFYVMDNAIAYCYAHIILCI